MPGAVVHAGTRPAVCAGLAAAPCLPPWLAARLPRRGNRAGAAASRWHLGAPDSGLAGIAGPWTREVAAWQIWHPGPSRSLPPGDVVPGDLGALAASTAGRPLP